MDFPDDGRSVVPVDVDGDGDLDLALMSLQGLRLLENQSTPRSFARIHLTATATEAHALGAEVALTTAGVTHRDWVRATDGFQSQIPLELHFGLAAAETIDVVRVVWPSGGVEEWKELPVNHRIALREGVPEAHVRPVPAWPHESRPAFRPTASPALEVQWLDGERGAIAPAGAPVVVNFWAPWCVPCKTELPQLVASAARFGDSVHFVGISVEREDLDSVRAAVADLGIPYPQAVADADLLAAFFGPEGDAAALPTTFVFDPEGALRRVFRRPIGGEELAGIVSSLLDEDAFIDGMLVRARGLMRTGRIDRARIYLDRIAAAAPAHAETNFELGNLHALGGDHAAAEAAFERSIASDPQYAAAHFHLGLARLKQGRAAEAIAPLREALRTGGDDAAVLVELGMAQAQAEDLEAARASFERAASVDPEHAKAHALLGLTHLKLGANAAARRSFERALAIDPQEPLARAAIRQVPAD